MNNIHNHGVLDGRRDTDFVAGTLPYEVRNPSGDWTKYLPVAEKQYSNQQDSMACVSFSALNCIEMQIKMLTGIEENLSDRFLAKVSGTTRQGNWLWKVAETLRHNGVPYEKEWEAPQDYTWEEYYSDIPEGPWESARNFNAKWDISYEWINGTREEIEHHLKHAPLQIVRPGHAISAYKQESNIISYFDHYEPYNKTYDLIPNSIMKIVVNKREDMKLTEKQVRFLQAIEGYSDPDGVDYWTGKELDEYINARVPDKIRELENV